MHKKPFTIQAQNNIKITAKHSCGHRSSYMVSSFLDQKEVVNMAYDMSKDLCPSCKNGLPDKLDLYVERRLLEIEKSLNSAPFSERLVLQALQEELENIQKFIYTGNT